MQPENSEHSWGRHLPCPASPCPRLSCQSTWRKIQELSRARLTEQTTTFDAFVLCWMPWHFFPSTKSVIAFVTSKAKSQKASSDLHYKVLLHISTPRMYREPYNVFNVRMRLTRQASFTTLVATVSSTIVARLRHDHHRR